MEEGRPQKEEGMNDYEYIGDEVNPDGSVSQVFLCAGCEMLCTFKVAYSSGFDWPPTECSPGQSHDC